MGLSSGNGARRPRAGRSGRQALAAMRPAGGDDLAATLGRHTGAVTVAALANQLAGLIGSLHGPSPGPCSGMATGFPLGKIGRPSLSCKRGGAARKAAQVAGLWRKAGGESMPKAHPATMPRGSAGPAAPPSRALKTLIIRTAMQLASRRPAMANGGKADDAEDGERREAVIDEHVDQLADDRRGGSSDRLWHRRGALRAGEAAERLVSVRGDP